MKDENILQFPKDKIFRERLPDSEQIKKMKEKGLQNFADYLSSDITDNILHDLGNYGIDIEEDSFLKDFYFATMILDAAIYRSLQIEHPMHEYINAHVEVMNKEPIDKT
jgi:hypothetical protein